MKLNQAKKSKCVIYQHAMSHFNPMTQKSHKIKMCDLLPSDVTKMCDLSAHFLK